MNSVFSICWKEALQPATSSQNGVKSPLFVCGRTQMSPGVSRCLQVSTAQHLSTDVRRPRREQLQHLSHSHLQVNWVKKENSSSRPRGSSTDPSCGHLVKIWTLHYQCQINSPSVCKNKSSETCKCLSLFNKIISYIFQFVIFYINNKHVQVPGRVLFSYDKHRH